MVFAVAGIAMPPVSFADTATTTASTSIQAELDLIASLEQQIQSLMQQITNLRQQQLSTTVSLVQSLSLGSTGNQVSVLQALLAADPSIYPQGLITGYFGPLTEAAVKRYQKANGIEQVGIVGPQTRGALNKDLEDNPIQFENASSSATSTQNGENGQGEGHAYGRLCAIVPPGHLIAPGWLRKNGGVAPIVPECQTLPPGIEEQLNGPSSTSTTLSVSAVNSSVTTSTATVSWTTNMAADSQVNYGLTSAYGSSTALDASLVTSHSEMITGLTPGTVYHFQVVSTNASGTAMSSDMTFTTNATETVTLAISAVNSSVTTSTATVSWTTNLAADSAVSYGTSTAYGSSTSDSALVTSHAETLTGLAPATLYHFEVMSTNASGTATSSDQTFTTNALPDTTPPVISGITYSAASTTANVSWTTNEAATGEVYYGTANPLDLTSSSTATMSTTTLTTAHSFDLSGLTASTTYYFVVQSADASANVATSSQQSFITGS
jgi:peptidoglycan hydrolase-like protein with peptidoglycan-binding domain